MCSVGLFLLLLLVLAARPAAGFASLEVTWRQPPAAGLLGVNTDSAADPEILELIRDAGFSRIRSDMIWDEIEPVGNGAYDFGGRWGGLMSHLRQLNMGVFALTNDRNAHYENGSIIATAAGRQAYGRWVAAMAVHWRDVDIWWELIDEANSSPLYRHNASAYAALAAVVSAAVKAAQPNATFVGPACCGLGHQPGAWLEEALEAGIMQSFDVATIHPYRSDAPEMFSTEFPQLSNLIAQ
jgi:hypothetical protein